LLAPHIKPDGSLLCWSIGLLEDRLATFSACKASAIVSKRIAGGANLTNGAALSHRLLLYKEYGPLNSHGFAYLSDRTLSFEERIKTCKTDFP
jgi:hypothetical protein